MSSGHPSDRGAYQRWQDEVEAGRRTASDFDELQAAACREAASAEAGEPGPNGGRPEMGASLPRPTRLRDVRPRDPLGYRVDEMIVRDEINGIVGDGGAGKSSLLLALGGAIACGALALGEKVTEPGAVLFTSGEDPESVIRNRLEAFAAGHRWDLDRLLDSVHVFDDAARVDLDDPRWIGRLIEAARDLKCTTAFFDPLVDLCGHGLKENDNSDAKRVTSALRVFMRGSGATPVLAMHVSKPSEGRSERRHRVRGASAWRNATRKCWWVEAQDGGMELEDIKSNRGPQAAPIRLKLSVSPDPAHKLMWRAAHLATDDAGTVVGQDVIRLLRWVEGTVQPPSSNDVEAGDHGLSRDRARAALGTGHTRGWLSYVDGPRRSRLWSVTAPGHARILLEGSGE